MWVWENSVLFKNENSGAVLEKCAFIHTEEIYKDLRRRLVNAHQTGKIYKRIYKDFRLHQFTARYTVYKMEDIQTCFYSPRKGLTKSHQERGM